ncbi:MAG: putative metalloprotease CJM1_0395 family protein [Pseudomonadota bacterium]
MQLTSVQPAISNGGGAVTRSTAPPGTASGGVPQTPSSSSPTSGNGPSTPSPVSAPRRTEGAGVQVSISDQARQSGVEGSGNASRGQRPESPDGPGGERNRVGPERGNDESPRESRNPDEGPEETSPEQQAAVQELRSRDQEVRQHEQAHQVVGGQYAGAPTYTYQRGENGQLYAVGGQVSIDTSPIPDDPEATISKMQTVRSAALAPAEPSPQDLQVAQEATRQLLEAQSELRSQRRESGDDGAVEDNTGRQGPDDDPRGGEDARVSLFRDVDGFTSSASGDPAGTESGFRATA